MDIAHYTDGKERSHIDRIKEYEKVFGISAISPFGTNNKDVFEDKLNRMSLTEMGRLAEKIGVLKAADLDQQKHFLRESFQDWQRKNGDPIGDKVKGDRILRQPQQAYDDINRKLERDHGLDTFAKIFPAVASEESFMQIIRGYTLTELRSLAARLGFNPSFDRQRLLLLLKKEFQKDLIMRSHV